MYVVMANKRATTLMWLFQSFTGASSNFYSLPRNSIPGTVFIGIRSFLVLDKHQDESRLFIIGYPTFSCLDFPVHQLVGSGTGISDKARKYIIKSALTSLFLMPGKTILVPGIYVFGDSKKEFSSS